jgi:hypothetical protein
VTRTAVYDRQVVRVHRRRALLLLAALPGCAVETQVWDPIPDPPPPADGAIGPAWPADVPRPPSFDTPPWVTSPAPGHIAIGWRTAAPTTGRVVLARVLDGDVEVDETPVQLLQPEETDLHHVDLGELEPASGYRYRVVLADGAEREGVFSTSGLERWRFIHLAEVHAPQESEHIASFADSIRLFRPQVAIESGDMVTDGDDLDSWRTYLNDARPWISNVILLPAHSNHVHGFLGNAFLRDFFELPDNERWYTTRYGDVQIVTLDSYWTGESPDVVEQPDWVRDRLTTLLADGDAPRFTIGAWHHPACSSSYASRTASRRTVIEELVAAFLDAGGIDLILVGHDKYYERSTLTVGGAVITHVMSNAGRLAPSAEGDNEPECEPVATDTATRSLPLFEVGPDAVAAQVVSEFGATLDRFDLPLRDSPIQQ